MADSEFEQFRRYFDKLPQYIKAPPDCYTLVPNINLLDAESPTGCVNAIPAIKIPANDYNMDGNESFYKLENYKSPGASLNENDSLIEEPFAGDLQIVSLEKDENNISSQSNHANNNQGVGTTATTTRKRRKLPEVPKRKNNEALHQHEQRCKNIRNQKNMKQLSLAEELFNAEKCLQGPLNYDTCFDVTTADYNLYNSTKDIISNSCSNCKNTSCCVNCSSNNYKNSTTHGSLTTNNIIDASSTIYKHGNNSSSSSNNGPFFLLKCSNNGTSSHDDESSSDSERYPSIDSGHSTIHSDDGLKYYSSQILSVSESYSPTSPTNFRVPSSRLEVLEATHRGLHKFIPRHHDEIEVDIGDPIYVQKEADDLWCEGVNLRSGLQGIFPSAYVVDVDYNDFDPSANKVKKERYLLNYLGSIETLYHKGNEVLCQAVKKIASQDNYVATHARASILEISDQGIHMVDKGKLLPNHVPCHDYFYALKNVSFCGFHPNDHRYFCFVTKHPTLNRFACHVFISDESTRPVAEAVGRAFQRFYQKFLETAYPIEDIYLE